MEECMGPHNTLTLLPSLCENTQPTKDRFQQALGDTFHRLLCFQAGLKSSVIHAGKGKHGAQKSQADLSAAKFARGFTSSML